MSSRQRRLLLQQQQLMKEQEEKEKKEKEEGGDEEEEEEKKKTTKKQMLLNSLFDDDDEEEEQEEEQAKVNSVGKEEEEAKATAVSKAGKKNQNVLSSSASQKKKKAKEKAKKQQKQKLEETDEDGDGKSVDIKSIQEVETMVASPARKSTRELLICENIHLDPAHEITRQFGKEAFQKKGGPARKNRGVRRRNYYLVTPDANWAPPPTFMADFGARMMKIAGDNCYSFEASPTYKRLQKEFEELAATHDPNAILQFLNHQPFHVDSLLQVSEIYLHSAQYEQAELFLRRALFTLESWLHPSFQNGLGSGGCTISVSLETQHTENESGASSKKKDKISDSMDAMLNKSFLLALSKSMLYSGRRGLFQTAFALNKTILSLAFDEDPLYMMLNLDYYALRSNNPSFVLDLIASSEFNKKASAAAASSGGGGGYDWWNLPNFALSQALASRALGREAEADALLDKALLSFPGVIELLSESSKALDIEGSKNWKLSLEWGKRADRALESDNQKKLKKILKLVIMRQTPIWTAGGDVNNEASSALAWVARRGARLHQQDIVPIPPALSPQSLDHYSEPPFSDFTDNVALISPADHMLELAAGRNQAAGAAAAPPRPNVNLDQNLLALFFNTLLPWAVLPDGRHEEEENNDNDDDE